MSSIKKFTANIPNMKGRVRRTIGEVFNVLVV